MTDINVKKPAPPKRPQCAFFIFKQEIYQQVKNENPGKKMTDITKLISEQYKQLPKERIDHYEQQYKESKEAFKILKDDYEKQFGKIRNEKRKKRKNAEEKKTIKQSGAKETKKVKKGSESQNSEESSVEQEVVSDIDGEAK